MDIESWPEVQQMKVQQELLKKVSHAAIKKFFI